MTPVRRWPAASYAEIDTHPTIESYELYACHSRDIHCRPRHKDRGTLGGGICHQCSRISATSSNTAFFEPNADKRRAALEAWVHEVTPTVQAAVERDLRAFLAPILKDTWTPEQWKTRAKKYSRSHDRGRFFDAYKLCLDVKLRRVDRSDEIVEPLSPEVRPKLLKPPRMLCQNRQERLHERPHWPGLHAALPPERTMKATSPTTKVAAMTTLLTTTVRTR